MLWLCPYQLLGSNSTWDYDPHWGLEAGWSKASSPGASVKPMECYCCLITTVKSNTSLYFYEISSQNTSTTACDTRMCKVGPSHTASLTDDVIHLKHGIRFTVQRDVTIPKTLVLHLLQVQEMCQREQHIFWHILLKHFLSRWDFKKNGCLQKMMLAQRSNIQIML